MFVILYDQVVRHKVLSIKYKYKICFELHKHIYVDPWIKNLECSLQDFT